MSIKVTRHYLSKKGTKSLLNTIAKLYPNHLRFLKTIEKVEEASIKDPPIKVYIINDIASYILINNTIIPSLILLYSIVTKEGVEAILKDGKYVVVDEGAIKPILRGADVMAPGIIDYTEFKEDDIVIVLEPKEHKPLAITRALISVEKERMPKKGKVLENLHYVGDRIWKITLHLTRIGGPAGI